MSTTLRNALTWLRADARAAVCARASGSGAAWKHMPALLLRRVRLAPNTRPADVGGRGAAVYIGFLSIALMIVSHARHTHSCTSYASNITHHTITSDSPPNTYSLSWPRAALKSHHHAITQPATHPCRTAPALYFWRSSPSSSHSSKAAATRALPQRCCVWRKRYTPFTRIGKAKFDTNTYI